MTTVAGRSTSGWLLVFFAHVNISNVASVIAVYRQLLEFWYDTHIYKSCIFSWKSYNIPCNNWRYRNTWIHGVWCAVCNLYFSCSVIIYCSLKIFTLPLAGVWSIAMSVSAGLFVCLYTPTSQNPHVRTSEIFCACYPGLWFGPHRMTVEYVMHFQFCAWPSVLIVKISNVFTTGCHTVWLCCQWQQMTHQGKAWCLQLPCLRIVFTVYK